MQTDRLERSLREALRAGLDRETGPDPVWGASPAARRIVQLERTRRWPIRELAVAAAIGATLGGALLVGALKEPPPLQTGPADNGWVAFTVSDNGSDGTASDIDIWFTALDHAPRRVVGSDVDALDQVCPAFAPDGSSIAFGSIEGLEPSTLTDNRDATLVIADVDDDGSVTARRTIDIGDGVPPPCAVWSPTGDLLAFAVPHTNAINPVGSIAGSEVWIVRPADGAITVIPDILATDLEWSPDGSLLAIAGGSDVEAFTLSNAHIALVDAAGGLRTLEGTLGATALTWSPDGRYLAYLGRGNDPASTSAFDSAGGMRRIEVATGRQVVLAEPFRAIHGLGPMWSPDGSTIAFMRSTSGEHHDIVLLRADPAAAAAGPGAETLLHTSRTLDDGSTIDLSPWRATWSPDGRYVLDVGWTYPNESTEETWIVAVPADANAPSIMLAAVDGIGPYDYAMGSPRVSIQVWQRRPAPLP